MPDAAGNFRGITVPELPWHSDARVDEGRAVLKEFFDRKVSDDSIHRALCVEDGCARCTR